MDPKVDAYLEMLFHWNRTVHLTAFAGPGEALKLGVEPSRLALAHLPAGARVLDVGSGGGFPGVVLALERPDLELCLCEPSTPKAVFLREAALRLCLRFRVEASPVEPFLRREPGPWDAVTVRGLKLTKGLIKRLRRTLAEGGVMLVWAAGDRAKRYEAWMAENGLEARAVAVPGAPLAFIAGRVPRGTSGGS